MKNWVATRRAARSSARWLNIRAPVKRHTMIPPARPSTTESRPKPISATDPARMATKPSTPMTPSDSQDSSRTRRASCPQHSREIVATGRRETAGAARTESSTTLTS